MIQANELRIGNALKVCLPLNDGGTDDYIVEITAITPDKIFFKGQTVGYATIESFNAIPLTEEILLKCGFDEYKKNEESYYRKGECFELHQFNQWGHFSYECGDNLVGNFVSTRVDYLHQLQNLYFALTGSELEVKL